MRRGTRGVLLIESLVALSILTLAVVLTSSLFVRKRALVAERLDREAAVRAFGNEWTILRTSGAGLLRPRERAPFLGPEAFLAEVSARRPTLTLRAVSDRPELLFVRLELDAGRTRKHRLVQEGFVWPRGETEE